MDHWARRWPHLEVLVTIASVPCTALDHSISPPLSFATDIVQGLYFSQSIHS